MALEQSGIHDKLKLRKNVSKVPRCAVGGCIWWLKLGHANLGVWKPRHVADAPKTTDSND